MKYIRTKDGRIAEIKDNMFVKQSDVLRLVYKNKPYVCVINGDDEIIKQADTIEELCDEFILVAPYRFRNPKTTTELEFDKFDEMRYFYTDKDDIIYGAIWTEWGLKYVAKMNEKGELELI